MTVTPINMAEAIIDPLWDPCLSGLSRWEIAPGDAHGLSVRQNWCWVTFEWARRPAHGPALRMTRRFDVSCAEYDTLLVSINPPEGAVIHLSADTDRGAVRLETPPAPAHKREYALPLDGAGRLYAVTLEIDASGDGVAAGWINWVGLQNAALLPRYLAQWDRFDARWEGYLQPAEFVPSFTPRYGLLVDAGELDALRARHDALLRDAGDTPFTRAGEAARQQEPERMVRDFVNFWSDTRYCRERDHGNSLLTHGVNAAVAGLLRRDPVLLRLGARYAMALAMCGRWDDGMICFFPGGTFEHRCFVQSLCVYETALLLDLAGEYFTDLGRDLLMRRIAEEGEGAINFNTWRNEYIFHCNQLAWFTPGRMLGYTVLEQQWPRARPYADLALADLQESAQYAILPDGGYVEGPTYFRCVGRDIGLSLYHYARARGWTPAELLPEPMRRTAAFAAAVESTDDAQDQIPICDAGTLHDHVSLAMMALALPESRWTAMYRKAAARREQLVIGRISSDLLLALKLEAEIPAVAPPAPAVVFLPDMGVLASTRTMDGATVKLLIMGNHAGAGHTHEDKGSFVLEFAGDTFAMDPGTCDYSSPLAGLLHNCERHNMLVPVGTPERPHPQCPLMTDVKPRGDGDATRFAAEIDATPGWEGYYTRWTRRWESPSPDRLTIRDDYALTAGDAAEWYWNTRLPVRIDGGTVTLTGRRGMAELTVPDGCAVRVDELPLLDGTVQRRIALRREGTAGAMVVEVRLYTAV